MQGVLALRDKTMRSVMTSLDNVFMLSMDDSLDEKTMSKIQQEGFVTN